MAFASGADNIDIVVRVDAEGAVTALSDVDKQIDLVAANTDVATKSFINLEDVFKRVAIAGGLVAGAAVGVGALISRGSDVDDVASAFQRLSEAAGTSADTFQNDLSVALGGTVSNFDLMRQANEQLRAGLSPDAIIQVADAARVLADETGGNAAQEIDELTRALLTGRDQALKTRGIVIDTDQAYADFAESIGTTADKLNEAGQIEAKRIAILEQLNRKVEETGKVNNDAADNISKVVAVSQNFIDKLTQQIATNETVNILLQDFSDLLARVDFTPLINGLTNSISYFVKFGTAMGEAALQIKQSFSELANETVIQGIEKSLLEVTDLLSKDTAEATRLAVKQFQLLREEIAKSPTLIQRFGKDVNTLTGQVQDLGERYKILAPIQEKNTENTKEATPAVQQLEKGYKELKDAQDRFITTAQKASTETEKLGTEAADAAKNGIEKVSKALSDGLIDLETYQEDLQAVQKAFIAAGGSAEDWDRIMGVVSDNIQKEIDEIQQKIDDVNTRQAQEAFAELQSFVEGLQSSLGDGLGGIFTSLLDGGDLKGSIRDLGSQLGSQAGQYFGQAFAGPLGGALGGEIGGILGDKIGKGVFDAIDHVFGGRDAQGKVRDSLDRFFAAILEDSPLLAIVEGQLQKITDLEFLRDTDAFETGAFDDLLQGLPAAAQAAFDGMGLAFSTFVEGATGQSSQLAAILANNLGGSLNNLQLLVQATGLSFDQMAAQVEQAFLRGEISAAQAFNALGQIQQISQKGIPDGIGLVEKAFENLKAAGTKGGAALVDALQDVGSEAKELGITTLAGVQQKLAETGQFSAAEIQQVFDALAAAGISSVDQLESATVQQLLPALAQLENTNFPFEKAVEDVNELIDRVNKIPDNVTKKVRVEVEYVATGDQQAQQDAGNTEGN